LTDHSQQFTAHLIEPQTLFSLVSGEKAENQKREYYRKSYQARREIFILQIVLFVASLLCEKKKEYSRKTHLQNRTRNFHSTTSSLCGFSSLREKKESTLA
jgi:hypothetical protein